MPANASSLVVFARAIVEAMTKNPWFTTPVPPLSKLQAAIDQLDKANTAALSRTTGLAGAKNEARKKLVDLLHLVKAYVQSVADENPDEAASIITSAALHVVGKSLVVKLTLAVRKGRVSGSVELVAKAVAKLATYDWQVSEDGGKTWIDLPRTLQAKTTRSGLVTGRTYWFRTRALTRRWATNWSDPVAYVVQ
jgi:hypothetical protein